MTSHVVLVSFTKLFDHKLESFKTSYQILVLIKMLLVNMCFVSIGIFLDGLSSVARVGGGLPANAFGDHPTCGRRALANGQHVHFAPLYTVIFLKTCTQT